MRTSSLDFNPRSHRRERRRGWVLLDPDVEFQPTLPPKGATRPSFPLRLSRDISTHAPTEGSDGDTAPRSVTERNFNPRSHRRERRVLNRSERTIYRISTHAPTEGSDIIQPNFSAIDKNFNPRSHRRERLKLFLYRCYKLLFQPTLPPKGATLPFLSPKHICIISTHAPTEGSDVHPAADHRRGGYFNPRSHRRERRASGSGRSRPRIFQLVLE